MEYTKRPLWDIVRYDELVMDTCSLSLSLPSLTSASYILIPQSLSLVYVET